MISLLIWNLRGTVSSKVDLCWKVCKLIPFVLVVLEPYFLSIELAYGQSYFVFLIFFNDQEVGKVWVFWRGGF